MEGKAIHMSHYHKLTIVIAAMAIFSLTGCIPVPIQQVFSPPPTQDPYFAYLDSYESVFIVSLREIEAEFAKHGFSFKTLVDDQGYDTRVATNTRLDMTITMPGGNPSSEPSWLDISFLKRGNQASLNDAQISDLKTFLNFAIREDERLNMGIEIARGSAINPEEVIAIGGDWWAGSISFDPLTGYVTVTIDTQPPE
jgi:hypothetical protein